jgi:xanthine permease
VAGLFGLAVAPFVSRLLPLFPPLVTGTIILVIGITLMRVGIGWAAGGVPTITVNGASVPNPAYGALDGMALSLLVLAVILGLTKYGRGFLANVAVLVGIVIGCVVAAALGKMSFAKVSAANWFDLVLPFQYGLPRFDAVACVTMCLVMIVVMIESTGMFLALGDMTARRVDTEDLTRGLRGDGLGTLIGGIFNTFPYTSFSQNVGLVGVTGIRSRYVTAAGGIMLLVLGLIPKLGALVESVPLVVLGGAGLVMFGMVAATGIRILGAVDFRTNRNNLFIAALAIGFGMIPLVAPAFFRQFPEALKPLLDSGILLTSISAVALNLYFNGTGHTADARQDAMLAGHAADL